MKTLSLHLVLPLSLLSFFFVTKWWYALPVDAPDTMYSGFPLVWKGAAWRTSLACQVFVAELIIDWLTYFLIWFTLIYCLHRFGGTMHPPRWAAIALWSLSIVIIALYIYIGAAFDHAFYFKRPYAMKILNTGIEFFWQQPPRN